MNCLFVRILVVLTTARRSSVGASAARHGVKMRQSDAQAWLDEVMQMARQDDATTIDAGAAKMPTGEISPAAGFDFDFQDLSRIKAGRGMA